MKKQIAIIGQTLGTPTEIYELLHGNNHKILIIGEEDKSVAFKIENIFRYDELSFGSSLTRKERRKLKRKNK
jgi:hypothetical protein